MKSMVLLTAEETIRLISHIRNMSSEVKIEGAQQEVTCPGGEDSIKAVRERLESTKTRPILSASNRRSPNWRRRTRKRECGAVQHDWSAGGGRIQVSRDDGGHPHKWNGELGICSTGRRIRPRYVPGVGSALKPGCAEAGIVKGIDEMIERMEKSDLGLSPMRVLGKPITRRWGKGKVMADYAGRWTTVRVEVSKGSDG